MMKGAFFFLENYNRQQIYNNRGRMYMGTGNPYARCACNSEKECSCKQGRDYIENMPLAMSYVPWQDWEKVYEPCEAIKAGTLFPELNLQFYGRSYWKR